MNYTIDIARTGNSVNGEIRLAKPNPKGRSICKVQYSARSNWSREHDDQALRIAAHWFSEIGGFALLRNHQMSHIVSRLRDGMTPQCATWAINAYAWSDWHRRGKRWTTIGKFFTGELYEKWLEESRPYRDHVEATRRQQAAAAEERHLQEMRRRTAAADPLRSLSDDELRRQYHLAVADEQVKKAAIAEHGRMTATAHNAAWLAVGEPGRKRALRLTRNQLAIELAEKDRHLGNDRFQEVAYATAHLIAESCGVKVPPVQSLVFPPATADHLLGPITREITRRVIGDRSPSEGLSPTERERCRAWVSGTILHNREATPDVASATPEIAVQGNSTEATPCR